MSLLCRDGARGPGQGGGGRARHHTLDITDEAAIPRLREQHGGINVLVNNAGVCFPAHTQETLGVQSKFTLGIN